jgi:hypothetical protein
LELPSCAVGVGSNRTWSGSDGPPVWVRWVQFLASAAVGVGSSRTAIDNGIPIPLPLIRRAWCRARRASQWAGSSLSLGLIAVGVGNNAVTVVITSGRFTCRPAAARAAGSLGPCPSPSRACGVGNIRASLWPSEQKHPLAAVRGADVGGADATPERIKPEGGQVAENAVEAAALPTERGDVFHDEQRRS